MYQQEMGEKERGGIVGNTILRGASNHRGRKQEHIPPCWSLIIVHSGCKQPGESVLFWKIFKKFKTKGFWIFFLKENRGQSVYLA